MKKISSKMIPMTMKASEGNDTAIDFCQQHPADFLGGWVRVFAGKMVTPQPTDLISGHFLRFQPLSVI